jgi:hypothetical protein
LRAHLVLRVFVIGACVCALGAGLASCGGDGSAGTAAPLPSSGRAYHALDDADRAAVARSCRDRAAARARGLAARQLRAIDPDALRRELDNAYSVIAQQRRSVARVCTEALPFVTPGLRVTFDGAKDLRNGTFTVETTSDKRLTIRGRIAPVPAHARVLARREVGRPERRSAVVGPDGRFALPRVGLRKVADNTFTVTIDAPPNAQRKVLFSVICLDCLAGAPPPSAQQ